MQRILLQYPAEELEKMYLGHFTETIRQGTEEGFFACADAAFSAMILTLIINKFWLEICDIIFKNETNEKITDPADLIKITENYRTSVERLLSAAYGSIPLIRLPELKALTESIHLHWKK